MASAATLRHGWVCARTAAWIALLLRAGVGEGHTFCIDSANAPGDPEHGLRQALAAAADHGAYNGEDNTIRIVRGTYSVIPTTVAGFDFVSTSGHKLDINGGYNADCSSLIEDPSLTVLDGAGAYGVMHTESAGDVSIRWITFQNGDAVGSDGGGLSMYLSAAASEAIVDYDIFRNNTTTIAGGGLIISGTGLAYIEDNLFTGNSAKNIAALFLTLTDSTVYVVNNTATQNVNSGATTDDIALDDGPPNTVYVSNNVFWGNTATNELDFESSTVQFIDNDITSIDGTLAAGSGGNQNVDPLFVGAGDFRLSANSPLLNAGTLTPPGNLPSIDIRGYPRSFNGTVDLGAYERGDEIFAGGFDD